MRLLIDVSSTALILILKVLINIDNKLHAIESLVKIRYVNFRPVIYNCKYQYIIQIVTANWNRNWRLLRKNDLGVIAVNLHFNYIYFYFSTRVYVKPTGKLSSCTEGKLPPVY